MSRPSGKVLKLDDYRLGEMFTVESPLAWPVVRPTRAGLELAGVNGDLSQAAVGAAEPRTADSAVNHDGILQAAEQQAQALIADAQRRAGQILAQAEAHGRTAAEQIRADMLLEAEHQIDAEISRRQEAAGAEAGALLAQAEAQRQLVLAAAQREMIVLALAIARRVVAQELRVSADVVLAVASDALAHIPSGTAVVQVNVNPADLDIARSGQARLMQAARGLTSMEIQPDPSISRGGCVLRSESGDVDSRIQTRLTQVETAVAPDAHGEGQ